ncbi:MAG: BrnA antitoxin family protein [Flavobacteriaceae bacterium]|nr:BrnA antitoxin family protein [Flavobacteriaceae bacterium]
MKHKPKEINKADWNSVDSPELSKDVLFKMTSVKENHPHIPNKVRGPQKEPLKIPVSIRLSPDIIEFFKTEGKGWQTKANNILREYVNSHYL